MHGTSTGQIVCSIGVLLVYVFVADKPRRGLG